VEGWSELDSSLLSEKLPLPSGLMTPILAKMSSSLGAMDIDALVASAALNIGSLGSACRDW